MRLFADRRSGENIDEKKLKGTAMPNKNVMHIRIAIFSFLIAMSVFSQDAILLESARVAGMGGAFTAIGNDANAISSNPAGLVRLPRTQLVGSYTKYFGGANIPSLQEGSLYFSPYLWGRFFTGIGVSYFSHDIYRQQSATVVFGSELWKLKNKARISAAINANLYRLDYNPANFSDDFEPGDPVFQGGYTKISFGGDFSILGEYGPASMGIKGVNLNEPEISLRSGVEGGRLPRKVRGGFAYDVLGYVTPALEFEFPVSSIKTESDKTLVALGAESWFLDGYIGARAGFNSALGGEGGGKSASIGLSLRSRTRWNVGIDYAFIIPIDVPTELGQTHKVSLDIGMIRPQRTITDLTIERGSVKPSAKLISPNTSGTISFTIVNAGEMDAKNFPVVMYYFENEKPVIVDRVEIERLDFGEKKNIEIGFSPMKTGYYDLFVSVNDFGDKAPAVRGKVLETDYDNNTAQTRVASFNPPVMSGTVRSSKNELVISTVSKTKEEIPIIPVVFFANGSSEINRNRFSPMLSSIAQRLKQNQDISIELRGFYDASTESSKGKELAIKRAEAVRDYLISQGVEARSIRVITDEYESGTPRIKTTIAEDREMLEAENRTVEFKINIGRDNNIIDEIAFNDFSTQPSREDIEKVKRNFKEIETYLSKNPDIMIVFDGKSSPFESEGRKKAFFRAATMKNIMAESSPQWLRDRFFAHSREGRDSIPTVVISMNADALLFRPRGTTSSKEGVEFKDLGTTEITIDTIISEAGLDTYTVFVREEDASKPFIILKAGRGKPPKNLEWDWFGGMGQAPDPEKKYFIVVSVADSFGQSMTAVSSPITVRVREQEERKELFLINFNFGKAEASSKYLEARVEALAGNLVERVKYLAPNSRIIAKVVGHTDVVGTDNANEELAKERARKEYENLRLGLMNILKLSTDEELDKWLSGHRVQLLWEGRSFREPMVVHYWEKGYWRSELVGDNNLPEGRLVNRRVVLEVHTVNQ